MFIQLPLELIDVTHYRFKDRARLEVALNLVQQRARPDLSCRHVSVLNLSVFGMSDFPSCNPGSLVLALSLMRRSLLRVTRFVDIFVVLSILLEG